MNLNKRVITLIIPVIIAIYGIGTYLIYKGQVQDLVHSEQQQLERNMSELAIVYANRIRFIDSYLYALSQSNSIHNYFEDRSDQYREVALAESLEDALDQLKPTDAQFASFALLSSKLEVQLYYENSLAPFAEISLNQTDFVRSQIQSGHIQATQYIETKANTYNALLVKYKLLDTRTLTIPLKHHLKNTIAIVVSIDANIFYRQKTYIEQYFNAKITLSTNPIEKRTPFSMSSKLAPQLYASISANGDFLVDKKNQLLFSLASTFLAMTLGSTILLIVLIQRFLISPITRLDRELEKIDSTENSNITYLSTNDEIGRLSRKFHHLYKEISDNYLITKKVSEEDQLTKLPNRYKFNQRINHLLSSHRLDSHELAIIYIDLDNFKYINDKFGHSTGDAMLCAFSDQLSLLITEHDRTHGSSSLFSRLSGDEFAIVLLNDQIHHDHAQIISMHVLSLFKDGFTFEQGTFPVSSSIGIAKYPQDGHSVDDLTSHADAAMYQSKQNGKNQYSYYSKELDKKVQRHRSIEKELRNTHFSNEFFLVFMPIISAKSHSLVGVEVLLRWISPELGFIGPDEFIPIAEQNGLYDKVDRWVIEQTFIQYAELTALIGSNIQVSLNLSSAQLGSNELSDFIIELTDKYKIPPEKIEFEITETFEGNHTQDALLTTLNQHGFQLALDDFGSGFTSITQLVQHPVHKIKFDRWFLKTLVDSNKQQVIKPLIELCHAQDMAVTAEGIEDESMVAWLNEYGCDYYQGYHFGKPMNLSELVNWHKEFQSEYEK